MAQIFICYRREGTRWVARNLKTTLQQHFGPNTVFLDHDDIDYGTDFRDRLMEAVTGCNVLLALINEQWLAPRNAAGKQQLDDPDDYVRIEIESALKREIPLIPVLVDSAQMPTEADLPQSMKPMAFRQAAKLRADDLDQDVFKLIKALENILKLKSTPKKIAKGKEPTVPAKGATPETAQAKVKETPARPSTAKLKTQKTKRKLELVTAVLFSLEGLTDSRLFVDLSQAKVRLERAIKTYAPQVMAGDAIFLYDNTVFGAGDKGMLLTEDRIYWRNPSGVSGNIAYREIKTVTVQETHSVFSSAQIMVNTLPISVSAGDDRNRIAAALARLIKNLADYDKQRRGNPPR